MQKIIPHLWFDSEAEEAVKLYTSLFKDTKVGKSTHYTKAGFEIHGQPEGKLMTQEFELAGLSIIALNGGPYFKFTPAISFMVSCESKEEVDELYAKLSPNGQVLMELGEYPFSPRYAWIADKYGLSWQLIYSPESQSQKIRPSFLFVQEQCGKAKEAITLYTAIFPNSSIGLMSAYGENPGPDKPDNLQYADFTLNKQQFVAMDSAYQHLFGVNEAISFLVRCDDQAEIDYFWDKLTPGGDPKAQQCGWLKDKFGVSWQISPVILEEMLHAADSKKVEHVTNAFLKMKKFNIAELEKAFNS